MLTQDNLEQTLAEIQKTLVGRPAFFKGSGAFVDEPDYDKEIAVFEDMQARLSLAIKRFQSEIARTQARKRDVRANQDLLKRAMRLQQQLEELSEKNSTLEPIAAAATLWDKQHEYHESRVASFTEVPGTGPNLHALHPHEKEYGQSIEAALLYLFAGLQAYILWLKRRKKK